MNYSFKELMYGPSKNVSVQFARSLVSGAIASLVDIAIFNFVVRTFGIYHLYANVVSFAFSVVVNFYLNKRWVFAKDDGDIQKDFVKFTITALIGLGLSTCLIYFFIDMGALNKVLNLSDDKLLLSIAKVLTIGIVFISNFALRKIFVFNDKQV